VTALGLCETRSVTRLDARTVTAERRIPAAADEVFAVLVSLDQHVHLDGSGMVQGLPDGPDKLHLGARFSMAMRQGPFSYRSVNEVTAYEENRTLAWRTVGEWRGRTVVGGQWWRYDLLPDGDRTLVRHSYEWGRAMLPTLTIQLPGYPQRMARTMPETLNRLEHVVLTRR
jgi:uncharacterized protein YndB with AHSA1/START domain